MTKFIFVSEKRRFRNVRTLSDRLGLLAVLSWVGPYFVWYKDVSCRVWFFCSPAFGIDIESKRMIALKLSLLTQCL